MTVSARLASESALRNNCQASTIYTATSLHDDFKTKNKHTLSGHRGAGYWIWKPQIILQEFEKCKEGDIVLYTDAGIEIINNINYLTERMDGFCFLFGSQYKHREWCKGDVLKLTGDTQANQLQASAMLFRATTKAVNFLMAWIRLCEIPGLIDDSNSKSPNADGFHEHRHDQAILTALQIMYQLPSHWWPASYIGGKFSYPKNEHSDAYPVIFNHHRKRNDEWQ